MKKIGFIFFVILLVACVNKKSKTEKSKVVDTITDTVIQIEVFPELKNEEVFLKNKEPFGEIINLKGKHITGDTAIFRLKESAMLVKENRLILRNNYSTPTIRVFSLPELKQLSFAGKLGNGPDEFQSTSLVPTPDSLLLSYLYDNNRNRLYRITKKGDIVFCKYPFEKQIRQKRQFVPEREMANVAKNDFLFVTNSKTGKSIYRIFMQNDTAKQKEIFNLALNAKRKSPFAYIGAFAINAEKNRMVYGYKYFKMLKFMDLEAKKVRTINFEQSTFKENTIYKVNGLDQNITHYWKVSAQPNYVYFLYSGRTPAQVYRDGRKGVHYIYIEQFDWNGNPIKKYRLDRWGYIAVDEANGKIYLASTNDDDPFYEYQLAK